MFYGYDNKTRDINAAALVGCVIFLWMIALIKILSSQLLFDLNNLIILSGTCVAISIGVSRTDYVRSRMNELLKEQTSNVLYDILVLAITLALIVVLII